MTLAPTARFPLFLQLLGDEVRWQLVSALAYSDRRAQELAEQLGRPANLLSYHLKRLRQAHLVRQRRSAADHRATYYSLDLPQVQALYAQTGAALHPALNDTPQPNASAADPALPPARVLFLCTHNSARSQMAEALLRHLSQGTVEAYSAGTVATQINPVASETMQARGISLDGQRSKHLDEYRGQKFDFVVTVCDLARESCPLFPGDPEQIHWSFPDPAAVQGLEARRRAFDRTATELTTRINHLLLLIERRRREQPGR